MGSMGHFQVSSTYSQRVLKLMKFGSNLGLVRTLKLGKFKENRSLSFRDIEVRNSRPHTQNGQYGPFQVSSTYSQRVLKLMKFGSNLGLVRTLKLGKFKENRFAQFLRYRSSK